MDAPPNKLLCFDERLRYLLAEESRPHFKDFEEVSVALMDGYARFARQGMPDHTIARVMLDATINFYSLFGTRSELPALFRYLADKIEREHTARQN